MNNFVFLCAVVLIQVSVGVTARPNNDKRDLRPHFLANPPLCNGKKLKIPKRFDYNEANKICIDKLAQTANLTILDSNNFNSRDPGFICHRVCMMQEFDLIENEVLSDTKVENVIKEMFPSDESAQLTTSFRECVKQFGNKMPTTGDCGNHDHFMCVRKAVMKACKTVGSHNRS